MRDFTVSTPYPEGAIMNLSRHLSSLGLLEQLWIPSRKTGRRLDRVMETAGLRARGLGKGDAWRIPQTREVLPRMEITRIASKSGLLRYDHGREAERFDAYVASHTANADGVLIGLPRASLRSFRSLTNRFKIFHEVNATPRFHNEALLRHFSVEEVKSELHSDSYIAHVEEEISLADLVLSPSTIVTSQLRDLGVSPAKIAQVPYGVDVKRFAPPQSSARAPGGLRLIYVGQISRRKGIPFLLAAMRASRATLSMFGPVVDAELLRGLPGNTSYGGVLSRVELARSLGEADAFIFPSVEDNFALAVLEAVSAGLPIISTEAVGAVELVAEDAVVVPSGDIARLGEALSALAPLSPEEREERAQRFRRDRSSLTWDRYSEQVIDAVANGRRKKNA